MKKLPGKGLLLCCGLLLLLAALCLGVRSGIGRGMRWQETAERWAGDSGGSYVQLACYFGPGEEISRETVYAFRAGLEETFTEAGLKTEGNDTLWLDCWSASGSLTVTGSRGSTEAAAVAAGGSFFDFHPAELRSGCFLRETDLMKDRVVLDERLAWLLFGSTDVAGLPVTIGEQPFLIAGVAAAEADRAEQELRGETPTVYLSSEAWEQLVGTDFDCYEVVLPETVEGYGESLVRERLNAELAVLQTVTDRFRLSGDVGRLKTLARAGLRTEAVRFPYWENAARLTEQRRTLLLALCLLLLLFPALCLLAAAGILLAAGRKKLKTCLPRWRRAAGDGLYELSARLAGKRKK